MARRTQTILAGTSLETPSDPVVRTAADLARRTGAELYLVHAHLLPVAYFAAPTGLTTVSPDLLETERRIKERLLDEQLKRLEIDLSTLGGAIIEAGAPHRMVLETAASVGADLIVIGAREGRARRLHGSTTDRVLRKATCPVWVVAGDWRIPPKHVLAPVDLSPLCEESLLSGLGILDQICDGEKSEIGALFVLTREEQESSLQFTSEQITRLAHEELDRFMDHVLNESHHSNRRRVRIGEIRREIQREIEETSTDLLIIGTHGRSGFERLLLGSVAADMAGSAPCDVLVVPPQAAEGPGPGEE